MKPQKIDVEDAIRSMRLLYAQVLELSRAKSGDDDVDLSFVDMQERFMPVREAFARFLIGEMNMGGTGTDMALCSCMGIASMFSMMQNVEFANDIMFRHPPSKIDLEKYKQYSSADHVMLHFLVDVLDNIMHRQLVVDHELEPGDVVREGGGVYASVPIKELKLN